MKLIKLKGRIIEHCGSYKVFREEMGMSAQTLSNRLNGRATWKLTEVAKACRILDIPGTEITAFFLPECLEISEA